MYRRKGAVPIRMPVLSEYNVIKSGSKIVDDRDNTITTLYCKRAAWAKVILDVNNEKGIPDLLINICFC